MNQLGLDYSHHSGDGQKPKLRDYQQAALDKTIAALQSKQAVLLVAPTGSGKTVMGAALIESMPDKRCYFLAPRRELIRQTCRKLDDVAVNYGVILAGEKKLINQYSRTQVASIDTLNARVLRSQKLQLAPPDLIIIDEAHVGLTANRARLLALWPEAKIVGLTATPCRSDGKAMGMIYEKLIEVSNVKDLTDRGFLVPARYFAPSIPDLRNVRITAGDYNQGDLDKAINQPHLIGDVLQHWMKHANDRRTVVFCTSIEHSAAMASRFMAAGIAAEHVDANTDTEQREAIFARFSSGRTQVLCNCTLASIGFDLPELDCVVLNRPTKSLGLYIQMLGRGLRPADGKKDCLVLDHAGAVHQHGFADEPRFWTLDGKYAQDQAKLKREQKAKEEKDKAAITCPECACVFECSNVCPSCGHTFPPRKKHLLNHDGDLHELYTKAAKASSDWWTVERRFGFFCELVELCRRRGYKPGWAAAKYKSKFLHWPPSNWNREELMRAPVEPSPQLLRWIKADTIKWVKSKRREEAKNDYEEAKQQMAQGRSPLVTG